MRGYQKRFALYEQVLELSKPMSHTANKTQYLTCNLVKIRKVFSSGGGGDTVQIGWWVLNSRINLPVFTSLSYSISCFNISVLQWFLCSHLSVSSSCVHISDRQQFLCSHLFANSSCVHISVRQQFLCSHLFPPIVPVFTSLSASNSCVHTSVRHQLLCSHLCPSVVHVFTSLLVSSSCVHISFRLQFLCSHLCPPVVPVFTSLSANSSCVHISLRQQFLCSHLCPPVVPVLTSLPVTTVSVSLSSIQQAQSSYYLPTDDGNYLLRVCHTSSRSDIPAANTSPVDILLHATLELNPGRNFVVKRPHFLFVTYAQLQVLGSKLQGDTHTLCRIDAICNCLAVTDIFHKLHLPSRFAANQPNAIVDKAVPSEHFFTSYAIDITVFYL